MDRTLTETTRIPFVCGLSYGYEIEVLDAKDDFDITDFLLLPEALTLWDCFPHNSTMQALVDLYVDLAGASVFRGLKEFGRSDSVRFGRAYRIAPTDPAGDYAIFVFVGDQLHGAFRFNVTNTNPA